MDRLGTTPGQAYRCSSWKKTCYIAEWQVWFNILIKKNRRINIRSELCQHSPEELKASVWKLIIKPFTSLLIAGQSKSSGLIRCKNLPRQAPSHINALRRRETSISIPSLRTHATTAAYPCHRRLLLPGKVNNPRPTITRWRIRS